MTHGSRRSYEESCAALRRMGWIDSAEDPAVPARRPRHDDQGPPGVSFFRALVSDDLSDMTLPRTFFGRSEICEASFRNTDLSESTLCWCDFIGVDFSGASLRACDLRASTFEAVSFAGSDLRGADLRQSKFKDCDFTGADVAGAWLTLAQGRSLSLSRDQVESVAWQTGEGDPPGGG